MPQTSTSRCKAQRIRKGLTLRQLADQCSDLGSPVDFGNLGKIERGEVSPHIPLRDVLIKILGLSRRDFTPHHCRLVMCSAEFQKSEREAS